MAQNVVINGVTYSNVPEVDIPKSGGGTATFYDPSDATATQGDILSGKNAYISGGKKNGSMPNNGSTSGTISSKDGSVTIPAGYTSGGTVTISSTEQAKIIANNIRSGVTLLGINGSTNVVNTNIASGGETSALYVKINGSWVEVAEAYRKVNGAWVKVTDITTLFNSQTHYKRG